MLFIKKYTFLFIFSLVAYVSQAQESMMPEISERYLDKLIAIAKDNYPKMETYSDRVDIARSNIRKATLDWVNIFTLSYLYSPNNTTTLVNPSLLNGYQIGIYTSIASLLQKPSAVRVAKRELDIAKLDQAEYNLVIEASVKERYYIYVKQMTILNLKIKTAQDAEASAKQMKYKFEKGEETFEDYNKASSFYSSSIEMKIDAESALLIAKSNLEEILGKKLEDIH